MKTRLIMVLFACLFLSGCASINRQLTPEEQQERKANLEYADAQSLVIMFTSSGIIHYDTSDGNRVTVSVEQSLGDYYYWLIPKYYRVLKPRWKAHVTVVSPIDEIVYPEKWGAQEGKVANFIYEHEVFYEKGFWWFNLFSIEMENIRKELGMHCKSRITIPPDGYVKAFHCTVGKTWIEEYE